MAKYASPTIYEDFDRSEASASGRGTKKDKLEKLIINKSAIDESIEDDLSENEREELPKKKSRKVNPQKELSSCGTVSVTTRKFPDSEQWSTAQRLHKDNVSAQAIEGILLDTLDGEMIIAEYRQQGYLTESSQQTLTNILINRSTKSLLKSSRVNDYFDALSNVITELFPIEPKAVYYVPPKSMGNTSKNPKGKLPDKWRNTLFLLRKRGILSKKTNETTVESTDLPENNFLNDEIKDHIKWLQRFRESTEATERWKMTFEYRKKTRSFKSKSLDEVLEEWPILKSDIGKDLIELEFQETSNSNLNFSPIANWNIFMSHLYFTKYASIRDPKGKQILEKYNNRQDLQLSKFEIESLEVLLLPYLIPATSIIQTGTGSVKPNLAEHSDGFSIWCKTCEDIIIAIDKRSKKYQKWKKPVQPCIILQGASLEHITTSYVILQDQLWNIESPVRAVDLLFKLYMAFNLQYPVDCQQIWMVIQQALYNIKTTHDIQIVSVTSLVNTLKVLMNASQEK